MKKIQLVKLAFINITTKRLRTSLTIGGIAISVAVTLIMIGFGSGIQNIVTGELNNSELVNVITVSSKKVKILRMDQPIISKFKSINGVAKTEQIVNLFGKLSYHGTIVGLPVYAVSDGYFDVTPTNIVAGKQADEEGRFTKGAIVNTEILKALKIPSPAEAIGKEVLVDVTVTNDLADKQVETTKTFADNRFTIIGVVDKGTMPIVYIPAENVFKMGVTASSQTKILVLYPEKIPAVREAVEQMGFSTTNIKDTIKQINRVFNLINMLLIIFGIVTLLVAVIGTLNTITISLVEQTREIGFLRLIGIRKKDVKMLFIAEALLLSTIGAILGVILAYILALIINGIIYNLARASHIYAPDIIQIPTSISVIVVFVSFVFGYLIGQGPSGRAVKIDPLKALKL